MIWRSALIKTHNFLIISDYSGNIHECILGEKPIFTNITFPHSMRDLEEQLFIESIFEHVNTSNKQVFKQKTWNGNHVLTTVFKEQDLYLFAYTILDKPFNSTSMASKDTPLPIIATSPAMQQIANRLLKTSQTNVTVLLLGESGVGKEMAARTIHTSGLRKNKPFVAINCGAIPENLIETELFGYESGAFTGAKKGGYEGCFRQANGGILFLDEIGELPLNMQVKLLRVLQERSVTPIGSSETYPLDIQIIAATNQNLEKLVADGKFREDLYYRLNIVPIQIPPLRERIEEIPALAHFFTEKYNVKHGQNVTLSPDAIDYLCIHEWPGNVRELENVIERFVVLSETPIVTSAHLEMLLQEKETEPIRPMFTTIYRLQDAVDLVEEELILLAMKKYGSVKLASSALGISQPTMSRKLKKIRTPLEQPNSTLAKRAVLEEQLNNRLRSVAVVSAITISIETVGKAIENLSNLDAHAELLRQLTAIQQQEGVIHWVFIFYKNKENKIINISACADFVIELGAEYTGPPEIMDVIEQALNGSVGITPIYTDQYGEWKTCFAPLYNQEGIVIAIIGYDYSKAYINSELHRLSRKLNLIL
ncbi:sigma-54 interaction domain-containing protein [Solibacillus sp. FSL H8-0538]|uniref:sigma-54 interaction domain-containing protein n=1 Tax=Solibacillus sp. FSL H8-0538 TaxID=2921400 RepID=UPI0030F6B3BB